MRIRSRAIGVIERKETKISCPFSSSIIPRHWFGIPSRPGDNHPVETSAYSVSEASDGVKRSKKRVRGNVSLEQCEDEPLEFIRGMEKRLVEYL